MTHANLLCTKSCGLSLHTHVVVILVQNTIALYTTVAASATPTTAAFGFV